MQTYPYFFILGRNPALSLAEILATFPTAKVAHLGKEVAIIETTEKITPEGARRLGGTVKFGEIIGTAQSEEEVLDGCERILKALTEERKIFGLSIYPVTGAENRVHTYEKFGFTLKRRIKDNGGAGRLVTAKTPTLSAVVVEKNHLLTRGAEIVLILTKNDVHVGRTRAVQEFEAQSHRDFGRPARNMDVGMVPVQLAKILVNLSRTADHETILDPFCGFGTIITEAVAMGHHRILGSDKELAMVEATEKNLAWLTSNTARAYELTEVQIFQSPVEEVSQHVRHNSVDAVVTEPYLGPIKSSEQGNYPVEDLTQMYIRAFEQFATVVRPGGRVVFIFPAVKTGKGLVKTSEGAIPEIKKMGFKAVHLMPIEISPKFNLKNPFSVVYSRPEQKVIREILVFEKK